MMRKWREIPRMARAVPSSYRKEPMIGNKISKFPGAMSADLSGSSHRPFGAFAD
jgi:hypothetical protein